MDLRVNNQNAFWYYLPSTGGEHRSGEFNGDEQFTNTWRHLSISFNKRAFKAYIDGSRVTNIPNMAAPVRFEIARESFEDHLDYIKNIRLAKGAVPLYDRMMSEGKFITYGITFDVGKSTIKPESMGEISRIVTLMKDNSDLKFSIEGHTDSTGNSATNQTLSEARSQAVMNKLVSMGITADRLKAAGKGQTSPIADNATDEGRAKNRRVEFVKIN
jgi:outer membrane protein OmpA-like peptidoglycan-associated protein